MATSHGEVVVTDESLSAALTTHDVVDASDKHVYPKEEMIVKDGKGNSYSKQCKL